MAEDLSAISPPRQLKRPAGWWACTLRYRAGGSQPSETFRAPTRSEAKRLAIARRDQLRVAQAQGDVATRVAAFSTRPTRPHQTTLRSRCA